MFKIYNGESVIAEGESPLSITGLDPNTDVAEGTYQVVRVDGDKESNRVDIPAFKTLPIAVTGVTLAPKNMTGTEGEASNRQMNPTVSPENATNKNVTYNVSPTTAGLTVNASGVLSWTDAVPAGTYTITVTTNDGGYTDTATVTVNAAVINVTGVTIAPKTASVEVGKTTKLDRTVVPSNAKDRSVSYTSSDETVATVSSDGTVTGVSEGEATITVTTNDGGYTDTCVVEVVEPEPEPEPDPEEGE